MAEIIIAVNHEQVYPVWSERGIKGAMLTHVDFHCDMRGIMIDRKRGSAFFTSHRESTFIDRGNFLAHAIMNGIINDLKWVHGPRGGRAFDIGPVVIMKPITWQSFILTIISVQDVQKLSLNLMNACFLIGQVCGMVKFLMSTGIHLHPSNMMPSTAKN